MSSPSIGIFLPTLARPGETPADVAAAARHAEALGFESVWVVDQLIAGTGVAILDSTVALTAAAAVTERVKLGFGVVVLPLHPVTWLAKQVASLQVISGGRVILGVGVGGDRHDRSWGAAGVPRRERGRRTDEALAVLPCLIRGDPVPIGDTTVELSPGAPLPSMTVGGMSDAAVARAVKHADDWFLLNVPPEGVTEARGRLRKAAAAAGRAVPPTITANLMVALERDVSLPPDQDVLAALSDPDGLYGIPAEAAPTVLFRGRPSDVAERLTALADAGAQRVVVTLAAGDWSRQAELLAEAMALLPEPGLVARSR